MSIGKRKTENVQRKYIDKSIDPDGPGMTASGALYSLSKGAEANTILVYE